ncbi:MAG: hypothetical protein PHC35_07925 [Deltaproteobacteria bacterium]|nr:hypothetical protein [Deltaproteobacteria bacterium]
MNKDCSYWRLRPLGCGSLLFATLLTGCLVSSASAMETSAGEVDISSTTRYQLQWAGSPDKKLLPNETSDQDFSELLGVQYTSSKIDGLSFSFLGKYSKDLDGTAEGSVFQDYLDVSSNERQRLDAYYAYAEKRDIVPGLDMRLGRQYVYGAEVVHFDGLWMKADRLLDNRFSVEAFGGQIVQMYSDLNKNEVGGINVGYYPMKELALYLNSVFYVENSFEAQAYWRPMEWLKVNGRWELLNTRNREASFDVIGDIHATDTTVGVNVFRRFKIAQHTPEDFLFDYTSSLDTINNIKRLYLSREEAYTQYTLSVSQPIPHQKGLSVFVRGTVRDLDHDDAETLYTTDFYSLTGGINVDEWLGLKGFHLSTGVTWWWEDRNRMYEAESRSVFLDARQELPYKLELSGGFYYKDEDVNSLIEGEGAAHYYGALKYKFAKDKWTEVKYEYERDDYYKEFGVGDINVLTLTLHANF